MAQALGKQSVLQKGKKISEGSFFLRVLNRFTNWIYRGVDNSFIARFLTKNRDYHDVAQNSFFWRTFVQAPGRYAKKLKMWCASQCEESAIIGLYHNLADGILVSSVRSLGAGVISYGIAVLLLNILALAFGKGLSFFNIQILLSAMFVIIGLLLTFGRMSIASGVYDSKLLRIIFVWGAGIRKVEIEPYTPAKDRYIPFIIAGLILGLSTWIVPLYFPPLLLVAVVFGLTLLHTPEFGILAELFFLPFLPTTLLAGLGVLTLIAFALKYIRGKRTVKMSFVALFTLFFLFQEVLVAFRSPVPGSSFSIVMIHFAFISVAFVLANTFRTRELIYKGVTTLLTAGVISAAVGVYQKIVGVEQSLIWVDTEMFEDISSRVFGTFDNPNVFGEYLVMLLPLALALFLISKGKKRIFPAVTVLVMGASLIFTYSRGAWLAALFSIALFLVFYHRFFFKLGMVGLAAIPVLPAVLPHTIVNRFLSIGNMADTSTSYRFSIWQGALNMIGDFWKTGSGIGSESFLLLYPAYALAGAQYALHSHNLYFQMLIELGIVGVLCFVLVLVFAYKNVFSCVKKGRNAFERTVALGLGTGILAMLVQALTDNVWYNFRIFFLFWILIAFTVALFSEHCEGTGDKA